MPITKPTSPGAASYLVNGNSEKHRLLISYGRKVGVDKRKAVEDAIASQLRTEYMVIYINAFIETEIRHLKPILERECHNKFLYSKHIAQLQSLTSSLRLAGSRSCFANPKNLSRLITCYNAEYKRDEMTLIDRMQSDAVIYSDTDYMTFSAIVAFELCNFPSKYPSSVLQILLLEAMLNYIYKTEHVACDKAYKEGVPLSALNDMFDFAPSELHSSMLFCVRRLLAKFVSIPSPTMARLLDKKLIFSDDASDVPDLPEECKQIESALRRIHDEMIKFAQSAFEKTEQHMEKCVHDERIIFTEYVLSRAIREAYVASSDTLPTEALEQFRSVLPPNQRYRLDRFVSSALQKLRSIESPRESDIASIVENDPFVRYFTTKINFDPSLSSSPEDE